MKKTSKIPRRYPKLLGICLHLLVLVLPLPLEIRKFQIHFQVQIKADFKVSLTLVKLLLLVVGLMVHLFYYDWISTREFKRGCLSCIRVFNRLGLILVKIQQGLQELQSGVCSSLIHIIILIIWREEPL